MSPSKVLTTVLLSSIVQISFGQKCEAGMFLYVSTLYLVALTQLTDNDNGVCGLLAQVKMYCLLAT